MMIVVALSSVAYTLVGVVIARSLYVLDAYIPRRDGTKDTGVWLIGGAFWPVTTPIAVIVFASDIAFEKTRRA